MLKFDEYVKKAKAEHGKLEIDFIKVTNGAPRTVLFSTYADFQWEYFPAKSIGKEVLVKIEKNHDRVYAKDVKYVGAYFIFPEVIVDENISPETYDFYKCKTAENGEVWHIRSLYVQQITEVRYNGAVVFHNDNVFDFGFIGDDGKEYRSVPYDDIKKIQAKIEQREAEKMQDVAEQALVDKKAAEFIKTGKVPGYTGKSPGDKGMIPIDVAVHRHLGYMNGWSYDVESRAVRKALFQRHHQLAHMHPEEHRWYNAESPSSQMHGFNDYRCICGFGYAVDSSD